MPRYKGYCTVVGEGGTQWSDCVCQGTRGTAQWWGKEVHIQQDNDQCGKLIFD